MKKIPRISGAGQRILRFAFGVLLLVQSINAANQRWHADVNHTTVAEPTPPLDDMAHMSWIRRDGASSNITSLAQTADGYLWIGSSLGLDRFDGLKFSPYPFTTAGPRLMSSDISALAACPDGGLWIGYRMGGITYLHGRTKVDYAGGSGLISESTEQLVCRPDGSVWATADGRLMHLRDNHWENYSQNHGLLSEGLYSLFFDRDGNLWTAEKNHVYQLKRGAAKFQEVLVPNQTVNQLTQTPDGTIWIADAWKNVRPLYDLRAKQSVRIPGVPVMMSSRNGSIWLAHDFGGITRILNPGKPDQQIENFKAANGLTDGQTRAVIEDRQGAIWIGTARGLDRFQPSSLTRFHGVHLDYYPALIADRTSGIWLNDMDKPLMRLRGGKLTALDSVNHGASSLFQDAGGGVWLIDPINHDFFRYTDDGKPPTRFAAPAEAHDVETWCIGADYQGNLLASFEGHGVWRYSGKWQQITAPELPKEASVSFLKDEQGRIWLGYPHNRIVMQDATGFHAFGDRQGLAVNAVQAFHESGRFMLAGGSDGLSFFDGQTFHALHIRSPNLLRGISGIVEDRRHDLWLNGALGVLHISAAEWRSALNDPAHIMEFQVLNERDGLFGAPAQSKPTPSAVMDKEGLLWFATSGHLVSIDPASVHWEHGEPAVLVQKIWINGDVYKGDQSSISEEARKLKSLEFDFIGIDLNSADRVTYQYMLEGQDSDWRNADTLGRASYTNLGPREYRFRARATNGTGTWTEMSTPIKLYVAPAIYQTTLFRVLAALSLVAALWFLYRRRVRDLTNQVQERLEARAYERLRIARDLHDTLLQGVQGLILRFHFATEQLSSDEPAREMLRTALARADVVITEGREKVRELRSDQGSKDLAEQLALLTEATQLESEANIVLLVEGEARELDAIAQDELFNIAREALTNAVRHAHAARIEVKLVFERNFLRLACADNGCGVSVPQQRAAMRDGHYGLVGMRERAERLGCNLEFSSSPGAGTKIQINVPKETVYLEFLSSRNGHGPMDRLSQFFQRYRSSREAEG